MADGARGSVGRTLKVVGQGSASTPPTTAAQNTCASEGGPRTVLLVDDDPIVRGAVSQILVHLGFEALVAGDGPTALELVRRHRGRISIVMLDVVMPGMDGEDVYHALRRIDPEVRVLIVSGFPTEGACTRLLDAGAQGFLAKPFQMQELAAALAAVVK